MSVFKTLGRQAAKLIPPALLRPLARPAVVYFHGVEPKGSDAELERIHHKAEIFDQIVSALNKTYTILPMHALDEVLQWPGKHRNSLFITFDDGYANNMLAAEILGALSIPWTLFVSTDHVENGLPDPIFLARLFFMHAKAGTYRLPHFGSGVTLGSTGQRKRAMERGVSRLKSLDAARAEESLAAMRDLQGHAELMRLAAETRSKTILNWDQVRTLHARGVEIGSHASVHWPMNAAQSGTYLQDQTAGSRRIIEAHVGQCRYFAYPFGRRSDCSSQAWHAVRDAGYSHAFTAIPATLDASRNPWLLPRYGIGMHEKSAGSMIPMLRANNWRFRQWQDVEA